MRENRVEAIIENMEKVVVGKRETIEFAMITLLAEGHLLLEDVPGMGKTLLAKTMAQTLGCKFGRIQFTPDTLPGDITGVSVYEMNQGTFRYVPGGIMNQIVLADEINRATPKISGKFTRGNGGKAGDRRWTDVSVAGTLYGNCDTESDRIPWNISFAGSTVRQIFYENIYGLSGQGGRKEYSLRSFFMEKKKSL